MHKHTIVEFRKAWWLRRPQRCTLYATRRRPSIQYMCMHAHTYVHTYSRMHYSICTYIPGTGTVRCHPWWSNRVWTGPLQTSTQTDREELPNWWPQLQTSVWEEQSPISIHNTVGDLEYAYMDHMHTHAHTCTHTCTCTRTHTHTRTPTHKLTHAYTHTYAYAHTHTHTHARTHACMHAHTHTHTHIDSLTSAVSICSWRTIQPWLTHVDSLMFTRIRWHIRDNSRTIGTDRVCYQATGILSMCSHTRELELVMGSWTERHRKNTSPWAMSQSMPESTQWHIAWET